MIRHFVYLLLLGAVTLNATAQNRCHIAWSHYTGWEPAGYIQSHGIAKKWGQKYNIDLQFRYVGDYIESINQYTAGTFDGVTITNIDSLTIPALGGVDTSVIIIGDFSNGNDAILTNQKPISVKNLANRRIHLAELSVSHYLLIRALQKYDLSEQDVRLINTSDADMSALIATSSIGDVFVTWNPIVSTSLKNENMNNIFDSSNIPGEIIDTIVVNTSASDPCKKAVTGAWYEAMSIMSTKGPEQKAMIANMADQAGTTVPEFIAQLRTTNMFYEPDKAAQFMESNMLQQTMAFVIDFANQNHLYHGDISINETSIGIEYPTKTWGNPDAIKLRFDSTYMNLAASDKL